MNTTTNATATNSAAVRAHDVEARWGFAPPVHPVVADTLLEDFFANAPTYTVVEHFDDLYQKMPAGHWAHLNELVPGYCDDSVNETSTPEQMVARTKGSGLPVSVLHV